MEQHKVTTFVANIYCGLKEGYNGPVHKVKEAEILLQEYCDKKPCAVSITKIKFIYNKGHEPGIIVSLINYPRFRLPIREIRDRAVEIATILKEKFNQERISVVTSTGTIMLGKKG